MAVGSGLRYHGRRVDKQTLPAVVPELSHRIIAGVKQECTIPYIPPEWHGWVTW